jgi:hypothetical protein
MVAPRVLLVEDDQYWIDILERKIKFALQGFTSEHSTLKVISSFEEAYESLKSESWSLLVTDIGLGDPKESLKMKGKLLLDLAYDKQIPAIAVSGTSKLTRRDVRDFYEKPYVYSFFDKIDFAEREKDFINRVQEILSKQSSEGIKDLEANRKKASIVRLSSSHALLVGIANYHSIRKLSKTTHDATDFSEILANSGYHEKNLKLLLDHDATKSNISKELDSLAHSVSSDSTVIIFFSGHGTQVHGGFSSGEYLCPVEAELSKIKDTCISSSEITDALKAIRVNRLVLFLDACHSGGVGEIRDPNTKIKSGLSEQSYKRLAPVGGGRVIISSCESNEVAWEFSNMRNGIFTHYLLEGIRGGAARSDGTIWVSNLFSYISEHIAKHKVQHPFQQSATVDFPLAIAHHSLS